MGAKAAPWGKDFPRGGGGSRRLPTMRGGKNGVFSYARLQKHYIVMGGRRHVSLR